MKYYWYWYFYCGIVSVKILRSLGSFLKLRLFLLLSSSSFLPLPSSSFLFQPYLLNSWLPGLLISYLCLLVSKGGIPFMLATPPPLSPPPAPPLSLPPPAPSLSPPPLDCWGPCRKAKPLGETVIRSKQIRGFECCLGRRRRGEEEEVCREKNRMRKWKR